MASSASDDQLRRLYRAARKIDPGQPGADWLARFDEADLVAEIAGIGSDDEEARLERMVRKILGERHSGAPLAQVEAEPDPELDVTATVELKPEEPTGALAPLAKLWNRVLVLRPGPEGLEELPLDARLLLMDVDGATAMSALRTAHPELTDEAFVTAIRAAASRKVLRFRKG